ncbi:GNAT superfamily N-acetyltransferase [Sphingomonas sp. SORGH_AS870]|uniref:GNAT family N-acetyltransferase n=1 Tax=Sphingomonas sp. SORGH_AS_0870 TaxID=3041801 RepID=UPI002856F73B|nr:GNAT family N-acetyltransferase [Sphingomonas sp. SORGH_AS_0870]MDR6146227.1 GNAT superfamily N-acetyltransferase [Sphingomonas sp. SORGH_AS_0870]
MMFFPNASPSEGPFVLTEHDAGDVLDLYARCIDYFLLQDGEPATLADAIELFRDVPEEKSPVDQTVLGWRGQNGLMAVVAILRDYPSNDVWYLGFMIVDSAARGKGIGRAIYDAIERWAVDRGAQEMRLAVLEVNAAAERFWRSLGYRELRRVGPDTFKARSHHRVELCRMLGSNLPA